MSMLIIYFYIMAGSYIAIKFSNMGKSIPPNYSFLEIIISSIWYILLKLILLYFHYKENETEKERIEREVIFSDEFGNNITIGDIKSDLQKIFNFYEVKYKDLCNETYIGTVSISYKTGHKKMTVRRDFKTYNISTTYENGNLMFEFYLPDNSTIIFNQYYSSGEINSSKTYHINDFSDFLDIIPENNPIPKNILLFYKILRTSELYKLIEKKNDIVQSLWTIIALKYNKK